MNNKIRFYYILNKKFSRCWDSATCEPWTKFNRFWIWFRAL